MGADDANEGHAPGECLEHDFTYEQLVLVRAPGRLFPGLGIELVCVRCGVPAYEPSEAEGI